VERVSFSLSLWSGGGSTEGFYGFFWFHLAAWSVLCALAAWKLRRRPESRLARLARGLCLSLLSSYALLVAVEGWLYFAHDTTDRTAVLLTSRRWTERHVRLNAAGFRDGPPPPIERSEGELRVLALGDSFTYGHGVADPEDRWTNRLERAWKERGVRARVMNAAKPGWSTRKELAALKSIHPQARFDLVIVGYVLNDHDDLFQYREEFTSAIERVRNPPPSVAFFTRRSLALDFLYARWAVFGQADVREYDELMLSHYRDPQVWSAHLETFRALAAACEQRGAKLLVVTFPFFTRDWRDYRMREVHAKLDEAWGALGVAHLDLLEFFERQPAQSFEIGAFDSHPNERAQALAAERILAAADEWLGVETNPTRDAGTSAPLGR